MERLIVFNDHANPVTEAYFAICTNVLAIQGEKKVIEVAGIVESGSASIVTANLAVAIAKAGKRVLVVDCNLASPFQHTLFGLQNRGLTDCLEQEGDYNQFVQKTSQNNLSFMAAGSFVTNNTKEVLLGVAMKKVLDGVKMSYDIILLDVPPVTTVTDAAMMGMQTDGVILVLNHKKDKVAQAQKAKVVLQKAGVAILGCVLDNVTMMN